MSLYRALLLLIILVYCLPVYADSDSVGSISGIVRDADDKPIAEAVVTLEQANARCQTDKSGHYTFPNVLPGSYLIRADAPTYISEERIVFVKSGVMEQISIGLYPTALVSRAFPKNDYRVDDSISAITLRRYGDPFEEYEITLRRDGTASYEGLSNTSMMGRYEGSVGLEDYRHIAGFTKTIRFFALSSDQGGDVVLSPAATLQVVSQKETKVVFRDWHQAPIELWGLESAIDGIASKIKWHKVEDKAK